MADSVVEALIIDLLEWVTKRDRTYEEVMEAWRTSCPRLPVWEEANDRGLVVRENVNGRCVSGLRCWDEPSSNSTRGNVYARDQQKGESDESFKAGLPQCSW